MLQFYFLSIVLNFFTGLVLLYASDHIPEKYRKTVAKEVVATDPDSKTQKSASDSERKTKTVKAHTESGKESIGDFFALNKFINDKSFRLLLGVLTFLTGIMKLLSVSGKSAPVIGDLLPAAAGIAGGFTVLLGYYFMSSTTEPELPNWMVKMFIDNKRFIGIACIAAAVLHFIFPTVLFF